MHRPLRALVFCLALGLAHPLLGGAARSQEDAGSAAERSESLQLELEAPDGSLRRIRPGEPVLTDPRLEEAWIVRVLGQGAGAARPAEETGLLAVEVTLVGGDRLRGQVRSGAGEVLTLRIAGGALLPLAIDALEGLIVPAHLPESLAAPLEAPEEGDRVYRRTGATLDRDDGTLLGFTAVGVSFESEVLGERSIPWSELAALFIETFEPANSAEGGAAVPVVVDLIDGGRLRGNCERLDANALTLKVGGSTRIALPLGRVASVMVDDGRLRYLSELVASGEEGRGAPFGDDLGLVLGHVMDRGVMGGDLRVAGRRYARGIGTHAPTRLFFDLPAGWSQLRGRVGVDDSSLRLPADARGSVVFRVKLDGELLWQSGVVRGGEAAQAMPPLGLPPGEGVRRLELEADPVEDFRGDRANWLELLLVR